MYAGQVWATEYIKAGKEFASDLQVRHNNNLRSRLGVKRTTTSWAVMREYGHEPLQLYCMLRSSSEMSRRVLKAGLNIHSHKSSCWTAQVLGAFQGLQRCDSFVQAVRQGTLIPIQEFTDDLRHRKKERKKERLRLPSLVACIKDRSPVLKTGPHHTDQEEEQAQKSTPARP
eukprot:913047-Pelagomonas_calceolata.AAC.1